MGHKYVKEEDTFSTSQNGTVPKPTPQEVSDNKFLRADGTWQAGAGGSIVSADQVITSGTEIGGVTIDGVRTAFYTPGHTYSETEQVVGKWIDGKPVYEKTVYCDISAGAAQQTAHGIASIDTVVEIKAVTTAGGDNKQFRPIPFVYASTSTNSAWYAGVTVNETYVNIEAGSSFGGRHSHAYVIIRYTKTTDSV